MDSTPDKLLWLFLIVAIAGWLFFTFSAKVAAIILKRVLGLVVLKFRLASLGCVKDVVIQFKKGAIASVSVGELRLVMRKQGLQKLWDWKLQLVVGDIEVVLTESAAPSQKKTGFTNRSAKGNSSSARTMLMLVAKIADYLNISVSDIVIRGGEGSTASLEVKDLALDLFSEEGTTLSVGLKLVVEPINFYIGEKLGILDGPAPLSEAGKGEDIQGLIRESTPVFILQRVVVQSIFYYGAEPGLSIRRFEVACGDASVNLGDNDLPALLSLLRAKSLTKPQSTSKAVDSVVTAQSSDDVNGISPSRRRVKLPEKMLFDLNMLCVTFHEARSGAKIENRILGMHLQGGKSSFPEETEDQSSQYDIQFDIGEVHLLRGKQNAVLEVLRVVVTASLELPTEASELLQVELDVKFGGLQCNVILTTIEQCLKFALTLFGRKDRALVKESSHHYLVEAQQRPRQRAQNKLLWRCSFSAPDMGITVYSSDDNRAFYCSSQTAHVYVNTMSPEGVRFHSELGEIQLTSYDDITANSQKCLVKEDENDCCWMRLSHLEVEWGLLDPESLGDSIMSHSELWLIVNGTQCAFFITLERLQSILVRSLDFERTVEQVATNMRKSKSDSRMNKRGRGTRHGLKNVKLLLDGFSLQFLEPHQVHSTEVLDPKKFNYGEPLGQIVITRMPDGRPRMAKVFSELNDSEESMIHSQVVAEVARIGIFFHKDMNHLQLDLNRGRIQYQELKTERHPGCVVTLFSATVASLVRTRGERAVITGANVKCHWTPDVHLFGVQVMLDFKNMVDLWERMRSRVSGKVGKAEVQPVGSASTANGNLGQEKVRKKSESNLCFSYCIDGFGLVANLADGVELHVRIETVSSEKGEAAIRLQNLEACLNRSRVLSAESLQISRRPFMSDSVSRSAEPSDSGVVRRVWEWLVEGEGTRLMLAYGLQVRAIEDAVEDMLRGLKLALAGQKSRIRPGHQAHVPKSKGTGEAAASSIRFLMNRIVLEIEDEPLQGWLDEHYRLMLKVVRERLVREHVLEEKIKESERKKLQKGGAELETDCPEKGSGSSRGGVPGHESTTIEWESMQKEMFKAYYDACTALIPDRGSGACVSGRQSGFKPSVDRASLLSIKARSLNVLLTTIAGGRQGMVERIRELDCVSPDLQVPFSRIYGYHVRIDASVLVILLRNYTLPMLSAVTGRATGDVIFAKQGTVFPKQIEQELYVGEWRRLRMLRSISGSTPPLKMYSGLSLELDQGRVCYGVGFEPAFADVSYALTVAMKKANLSRRKLDNVVPVKKERSLPWWDDMRYYVHGQNSVAVTDFQWSFLATTDPYEDKDMLVFASKTMLFKQSEGAVSLCGRDFEVIINQECGTLNRIGCKQETVFLRAPIFELDIRMHWECESGDPLQHYLHALPGELDTREKMYDPFRSYFLAFGWNFCFRENYALYSDEDLQTSCARFNDIHVGMVRKDTLLRIPKDIRLLLALEKLDDHCVISVPIMHLSAVDLMWVFKWWNLLYSPPHKLRSFSKWPRFGIPRSSRSGNLSLDKVLCEFLLRVDSTPACIEHASVVDDDPANGLTFNTAKLKYEILYSRGFNRHHPEGRRELLEMVYQGLDTHMLKAKLDRSPAASASEGAVLQAIKKAARVNQLLGLQEVSSDDIFRGLGIRNASDEGFLLSTDHFKSRRQTPKADPTRLACWQVGDMDRSNGLSHSDPGYNSEPSDDEGFDVVLPDNCLRVSLYELKLLWTICNRDAVWAWVGEISKAFGAQKPSPSRQYAQRKKLEDAQRKKLEGILGKQQGATGTVVSSEVEISPPSGKLNHSLGSTPKVEEEKLHFLVNVVRPQFNLHSEDATGRFLLAAGSGRVLARSFTVHSGYEIIEEALRSEGIALRGTEPIIPWKRRELSVWLERVQAHVAPCDVDLGAGLQWLPRIPTRTIPDRTGPLLERVFMPCSMFFQYTRHKGDTPDWKVKSLKELSFNSSEIKANMTSRQFQVMVDIIGDLLLARLPKPRKNSSLHPDEEEEEEEAEEETDEVVPEGVEEVELARIKLELAERRCRLVFDDIRNIKQHVVVEEQNGKDFCLDHIPLTGDMESTGLVKKLELDFASRCKARRAARASLRGALQRAAHQRLMEKEKYKTPSAAMSISWAIDKVVWRMLSDGTAFARAEISDMILNVDRDFNDQGVALFTMKSFVVQDCLQTAKLNDVHASLLSAWNPPAEWGRNCMLRVFAKQGAPKDGHSPLELFEVEVFPLKIHLTEAMYRMMWDYFFPEDDQNSQERQEARRLSAISMSKRAKLMPAGASGKSTDQQVDVLARSASGGLFEHLSSRELKRGAVVGSLEGRISLSMERNMDEIETEGINEGLANPLVLPSAGSSKLPAPRRHCSAGGGGEFLSVDGASKPYAYSLAGSNKSLSRRRNSGPAISGGSFAEHGSARLKEKDREKDSRRSSRDSKSSLQEEKDAKVRKSLLEFHNIKISQVELTVTYEGSRFAVSDLRLLMDTFARPEFTGSWRRLFSQVKKHIIWSVLKSVTGMQGKKFKDKLPAQEQADSGRFALSDSNSSDSGGSSKGESLFLSRHKRQSDRAGAAFVSSVKGIFNSQRRKAAALVRRTMPGEGDMQGDWSEGEAESINRQGSISKAKQLIRRHAKKFRPTIRLHGVSFFGERLQLASSRPSSDEDSDASSAYENPME